MTFEHIPTHLEEILERELNRGQSEVGIIGTSSPSAIAFLLCNQTGTKLSSLPHLVVTPDLASANRFINALAFFDSERKAELLPAFDVSPYSGLYPNPRTVAHRLRFLHRAQHAKGGDIFVAPLEGLLQKTLPFKALADHTFLWKKGQELPQDLSGFLSKLGYVAAPLVEDVGQFSIRGGIVDFFCPNYDLPIRAELFGEQLESLRIFDPKDQRSVQEIDSVEVIPARETLWADVQTEVLIDRFRKSCLEREVSPSDFEEAVRAINKNTLFDGIDFLLPYFYKSLSSPVDHFSQGLNLWKIDPIEFSRQGDQLFETLKDEFASATTNAVRPEIEELYLNPEALVWPEDSRVFEFSSIELTEFENKTRVDVPYSSANVLELSTPLSNTAPGSEPWTQLLNRKFEAWADDGYQIFVSLRTKSQAERFRFFLEKFEWSTNLSEESDCTWNTMREQLRTQEKTVQVVLNVLPESFRLPSEKIVFVREEDLFGKKFRLKQLSASDDFQKQAKRLSFGDLKPGDCVVHILHGIGIYEGLKIMAINGIDAEFIQIGFRDKDKLYLPIYRVAQLQRFAGSAQTTALDKLGGQQWEKTKAKAKGSVRDLARELLVLYAKRAELVRPPLPFSESDFAAFESAFPYDETDDQLRAIRDVVKDFQSTKPMDRLVCGDVGFGKTEVAMRAAFAAVEAKKQVAVLAPTTVLTFQHLETFKKRFRGWPVEIRALNRFVSNADAKKTLDELKEGKVNILIGTHRLLSKDVEFIDLGLLIIDEEQKFGVAHKERIRKMKTNVDTLAMSATPIPRTLNMSLNGIRDLSLINTAPVDRLPTRTFITKWNEETIRKAITSEIARGGQVYFIHNRIQSIYGLADEIRKIVPEARLKIGHGQMEEHELEKTMVQFFNHEIDVLLCTTIIESGIDVPRANTMFIDQAQMMGLSQLYQLRGRVGRSKQRAYCYLLLPRGRNLDKDAQERLKILQENTDLGSGIRIAQYDLELRGAGEFLGEDQSGHINSVGYELYMDLLNETIQELRGQPPEEPSVEPDINLRIPALFPESYIGDIRIRLAYYKALAEIETPEELENIEGELRDQFGPIPEPALNLMGLMLIRSVCRKLGVKDLSAGPKNISLLFTERTKLKPETVIQLASKENKKYAITPDSRLSIRMNAIAWPAVYEELQYLLKQV